LLQPSQERVVEPVVNHPVGIPQQSLSIQRPRPHVLIQGVPKDERKLCLPHLLQQCGALGLLLLKRHWVAGVIEVLRCETLRASIGCVAVIAHVALLPLQ
jgi:hypothetical protein